MPDSMLTDFKKINDSTLGTNLKTCNPFLHCRANKILSMDSTTNGEYTLSNLSFDDSGVSKIDNELIQDPVAKSNQKVFYSLHTIFISTLTSTVVVTVGLH